MTHDTRELVERLRSWDRCYPGNINIETAINDSINTIEQQSAEIARLREAVKRLLPDFTGGIDPTEPEAVQFARTAQLTDDMLFDTGNEILTWGDLRDCMVSQQPRTLTPAEQTLLTLVQLVREYLPSDGISKDEFINRVIEALDNPQINPVIRELENGSS